MIEYRIATETELQMVVETHIQCFPDYFLASLGNKLLYSYYKCFFIERNLFAVAFDNGKMIGFAMGHLCPSEARQNFERENAVLLFFRLLALCIKLDKNALERCTSRLFRKKTAGNNLSFSAQADATLLSIGVLEEYRRQQVASQLVAEFESLLKQYHVKSYTSSVRKENVKIQAFYNRLGFIVIEEASDGIRYFKEI